MEFVILIALAGLIVFWVRKRKRRAKETLDLTLAVVGFEASGKTVFIGSMFNELRVPDASGIFRAMNTASGSTKRCRSNGSPRQLRRPQTRSTGLKCVAV